MKINYIETIGIEDGQVVMVTFAYNPTGVDGDEVSLKIPLLALVNVPGLRVQDVTVEFDMSVSTMRELDTDVSVKYGGFGFSVRGNISYRSKKDVTANYAFRVNATQAPQPPAIMDVVQIMREIANKDTSVVDSQ